MNNILLALRTALAIIPEVIAAIKAIEVPGNGAAKAAVVVQIIIEAFNLLPEEVLAAINLSKVAGFAQKVISIVVGFLNAVGVFKK